MSDEIPRVKLLDGTTYVASLAMPETSEGEGLEVAHIAYMKSKMNLDDADEKEVWELWIIGKNPNRKEQPPLVRVVPKAFVAHTDYVFDPDTLRKQLGIEGGEVSAEE